MLVMGTIECRGMGNLAGEVVHIIGTRDIPLNKVPEACESESSRYLPALGTLLATWMLERAKASAPAVVDSKGEQPRMVGGCSGHWCLLSVTVRSG